MQIQLSTDNHLAGCDYLALRLEAEVRTAVLKSPPDSPKANANCEQVIGTIRRESWIG